MGRFRATVKAMGLQNRLTRRRQSATDGEMTLRSSLRRLQPDHAKLVKELLEAPSLDGMTQEQLLAFFKFVDSNDDGEVSAHELRPQIARFKYENVREKLDTIVTMAESYQHSVADRHQLTRDGSADTGLNFVQFESAVRLAEDSGDLLRELRGVGHGTQADAVASFLEQETTRKESLTGLPVTMLLFGIFWWLVLSHLQILESRQVSTGLLQAIDVPPLWKSETWGSTTDLWNWLEADLTSAIDISTPAYPSMAGGRIARYNRVLTMRLSQTRGDLAEAPASHQPDVWLPSACGPDLARLRNQSWIDDHTQEVELVMITYNPDVRGTSFSQVHTRATYSFSGYIRVKTIIRSMSGSPQGMSSHIMWLDILYLMLAAYGFVAEVRVTIALRVRHLGRKATDRVRRQTKWMLDGLSSADFDKLDARGLSSAAANVVQRLQRASDSAGKHLSQFSIWMFVEFISMVALICNVTTYFNLLSHLKVVRALVAAMPNTAHTISDAQPLVEMDAAVEDMTGYWWRLRFFTCFNAICVLARFFKAFRSNPRLSVVTRTLNIAAVDLGHFLLVFSVVFGVFVITGHIFFGGIIYEFADIWSAPHIAFEMVMGDFDLWTLTQGTDADYGVAVIWFWFFEIMIVVILVNMFLVILLDAHNAVSEMICVDDSSLFGLWWPPQEFTYSSYPPQGLSRMIRTSGIRIVWPESLQELAEQLRPPVHLTPEQAGVICNKSREQTIRALCNQDIRNTDLGLLSRRIDLRVSELVRRLDKPKLRPGPAPKRKVRRPKSTPERSAPRVRMASESPPGAVESSDHEIPEQTVPRSAAFGAVNAQNAHMPRKREPRVKAE